MSTKPGNSVVEKLKGNDLQRRGMFKTAMAGVLAGVGTVIAARPARAQGISHAMWTHGHSMQIEYPDRLSSVWRAGFYIRVEGKPGLFNWFHFAIPTPVIVSDNRLRAESVMLRFRTGSSDAFVNAVHVYDGEEKIASYDKLNLAPNNMSFERFQVPGEPEIRWGLGISVGVGFGVEALSHRMEFSSAGCDFYL